MRVKEGEVFAVPEILAHEVFKLVGLPVPVLSIAYMWLVILPPGRRRT